MTGTTGSTAGFRHPIYSLAGRPVMASLTVVDLLRESEVGEIVHGLSIPNDYIRVFEHRGGVNLHNHHFEIEGVSSVWIRCLWSVASDADLDLASRTTVERQRIVAFGVTRFCSHHIPYHGYRTPIGNPIVDGIGDLRSQIEFGKIPLAIKRYCMGRCPVVCAWQDAPKSIGVGSFPYFLVSATRISSSLGGRLIGNRTGLDSCRIGDVLRLSFGYVSGYK